MRIGRSGEATLFWAASGFGRVDAISAFGGVLLLGILVWCGFAVGGERRRIFVCAHHEKILGDAFNGYASDQGDALPRAVLNDGTNSTSWDKEIAPYLVDSSGHGVNSLSSNGMDQVAYLFKCPSDKEPRGGSLPRSYSMPIYDLNKVEWPPTEDCLGGLGLNLDAKSLKKVRGSGGEGRGVDATGDWIPAIKRSMVPDPADTALLVERISILNALWQTKYACVVAPREQFDAKTFRAKDFHGGKMNYLMLDGHVELLWPAQSGGHLGSENQGLWTIRPD